MSPCHHVEFYESEPALFEGVARFLACSLNDGGAAVVVATEQHRAGFSAALATLADTSASFVSLDAPATLDRFMVQGRPDRLLFQAAVGGLIQQVLADAPSVRIYGEMVAVLWEQGNPGAAIALEDLWNELGERYPFELFCAYPMSAFNLTHRASLFWKVCDQHTSLNLTFAGGGGP
ncbi:MAG: MEDS domain-containing protein [Actinomycetota bacterium]